MFSVNLLQKNEDALLQLKFDEILAFLNTKLFDCYLVGRFFYRKYYLPDLHLVDQWGRQ